jgi:Phosphodiester glycosidase
MEKTKQGRIVDALILSVLVLSVVPSKSSATTIVNPWEPIFQGIDYTTGSVTDEAVNQVVNAFRINLTNPRIRFYSTAKTALAPSDTLTQTTSSFLRQYGLQVAVNANYFNYSPSLTSQPTNLIGLAISNGQTVHPTSEGNTTTLAITQGNVATIVNYPVGSVPTDVYTAISGIPELIINGQINTQSDSSLSARTAAGLSQDGKFLTLLTIDGGRPGVSDGATFNQTAQWLQTFGAYNAVNLDGGGSTTIVRQGVDGLPQVLNTPKDFGLERLVGNNFGVFADALDVPEAANYLGGFLALSLGLALRRSSAKLHDKK